MSDQNTPETPETAALHALGTRFAEAERERLTARVRGHMAGMVARRLPAQPAAKARPVTPEDKP